MDTTTCCKILKTDKDSELSNAESTIDQLPDEILVRVLSLVKIQEAGRCSVLSRRWKDLWKLTTCINFDASESLLVQNGTASQSRRYVQMVNHVLSLHRRPSLDEFRLYFGFHWTADYDIMKWIKLVIDKRLQRLEIGLGFLTQFKLSLECIKHPNVGYLTSVVLSDVRVFGESIEYLLSNCPNLEILCISRAFHRFSIKASSLQLPLKVLEISECLVDSIELSAPRLTKFQHEGMSTKFHIGENPLLADLSLGWQNGDPTINALPPFSSHFSQLKVLKLLTDWKDTMEIQQFPGLINLKHLTLEVITNGDQTLLGLTELVVASPSLEKFTLQRWNKRLTSTRQRQRFPKPLIQPHRCLKCVEIFGCAGGGCNIMLPRYMISNAINLEKVVVDDTCNSLHQQLQREIAKRPINRRGIGEKRKKWLPPRPQLIVTEERKFYNGLRAMFNTAYPN